MLIVARAGVLLQDLYTKGLAPAPSRILIRAGSTPSGTTAIRVVGTDGQTLTDRSVAGDWASLLLSPKGAYVYANASGSPSASTDNAEVVRLADGTVVWQGLVAQAAFARDDQHFSYIPSSMTPPIRLRDLASGADTTPASTQPPLNAPPVSLTLVASTADRVVVSSGGGPVGYRLWFMNWQTAISPFATDTPSFTDEVLGGLDPSGTRALWSRQTNGYDGNPVAFVGAYEIDFSTTASQSVPVNGLDCYGRPASSFAYQVVAGAVQRCTCGDGACTTIATVPANPDMWTPRIVASANGASLVVVYDWPLNRLPTTFPDMPWLSSAGTLIATLPNGSVTIDDSGRLVLIHQSPLTGTNRIGIADPATGNITWIGTPAGARIVYE